MGATHYYPQLHLFMPIDLPSIYFYIPQSDWPEDMPETADTYWQGFARGIYCWTLQTYLRLKADGFPCQLIGSLPSEGIVLAHRDSLADNLPPPGSRLLIVCLKAERDPHPSAQLHIVQNRQEALTQSMSVWKPHYIPLWPQTGLICRDFKRNLRFENVAYCGHERNLAPELKSSSWQEQVSHLGLHWYIASRNSWNDYSEVDVILAVRPFKRNAHLEKPATKLFNAWHAGVPAVLGRESAFQAERKSELDYIEVATPAEVLSALKRLRDDQKWRQAIVENGRIRAEETQVANLVNQWRNFITHIAAPAYERWCAASSWTRQTFLMRRYLALKMYRMQNRMEALISDVGKSAD
jgi:hypothetical protein